jgi:hypothetical protein
LMGMVIDRAEIGAKTQKLKKSHRYVSHGGTGCSIDVGTAGHLRRCQE